MNLFNFLEKIFDFIFSLLPNPLIVRATHGGCKWVLGKWVKELKPGFYWYFPICTEVLLIVTARQSHAMESQALITQDGHEIAISSVAIYKISDVITAIGEANYDPNSTVEEIAQSEIMSVVLSNTLDELIEGLSNLESEINKQITERVKEALIEFGIDIVYVKLNEISTCSVHKVLGVQSHSWSGEE